MASASDKENTVAENKVPASGDHDRVQMLSLRADGTPDQHNPEFIGDKDATLAATTEQFRQQAVSAADVQARGASAAGSDSGVQDPSVEELKKAHGSAAKSAESAAKKAVDSLHQGS